jgi:hypothetical protein
MLIPADALKPQVEAPHDSICHVTEASHAKSGKQFTLTIFSLDLNLISALLGPNYRLWPSFKLGWSRWLVPLAALVLPSPAPSLPHVLAALSLPAFQDIPIYLHRTSDQHGSASR